MGLDIPCGVIWSENEHEKRTHRARWNSLGHPHSLVTKSENTKTPPLSPEHIPVVPNIIIIIHNTHIIKFRGEPSLKVPVKRKWYGKYKLYSEKQRNGQYIFSAINPFFQVEINSMCRGNLLSDVGDLINKCKCRRLQIAIECWIVRLGCGGVAFRHHLDPTGWTNWITPKT